VGWGRSVIDENESTPNFGMVNLLSFGTKDLTKPTIGIQSAVVDEERAKSGLSTENSYAANHLTTTFNNKKATPFCLYQHAQLYTELSAVSQCC
jgi:hypothetical protein